jgi:hypothetical protein
VPCASPPSLIKSPRRLPQDPVGIPPRFYQGIPLRVMILEDLMALVLLGESKTSGGESVVVVRRLERMIVCLWLCLLHAAIRLSRIPDPNPSSLSPPSLCSPIASDPTPFNPPQMVTSASPHRSFSCPHLILVVSVLNPHILVI